MPRSKLNGFAISLAWGVRVGLAVVAVEVSEARTRKPSGKRSKGSAKLGRFRDFESAIRR